jgi:SNF2 family DNA or RNA helicase
MTDSRVITNMYPHQKQALHFLTKCEHPEEHNGGGLWKKHLNGTFENLITGESVKGQPVFHRGGILADDMGLGKTIEIISLVVKSLTEATDWVQAAKLQNGLEATPTMTMFDPGLLPAKGTLIVCPLSTVSNWEDQIQTHVRRGALSVYVYHGAARCQDPRVLSKFVMLYLLLKWSDNGWLTHSKCVLECRSYNV